MRDGFRHEVKRDQSNDDNDGAPWLVRAARMNASNRSSIGIAVELSHESD